MFRRALRPYRRFRKYSKGRLARAGSGTSFLQMRSKIRKTMDPPGLLSKRRKVNMLSQNLFSEEEDQKMGVERQGASSYTKAPLSKVRFLPPETPLFDYHHFCRRVSIDPWVIVGTTGHEEVMPLTCTVPGTILDMPNLAAVYDRFRVNRIRWDFTPNLLTQNPQAQATTQTFPEVAYMVFKSAQDINNAPSTFDGQVDDTSTVIVRGNQAFSVDTLPIVMQQDTVSVNSGSTNIYSELDAPWLPTTSNPNFFVGQIIVKVPYGYVTSISQIYSVVVTTWFDMDSQK